MNNIKISPISINNINTVQKIITSNKISESEKTDFLLKNRTQINKLIEEKISTADYKLLIKNRPLLVFRPIKNSFTKRGDKILLAKTLNISPNKLNDYIDNVIECLKKTNNLDFLPESTIEAIRIYIFRHGCLDGLLSFLDFKLKNAKDITKEIYKTLEYNNESIADYFVRPIHRLTNNSLVKIYNIIDQNIEQCYNNGQISEADRQITAQWAFVQLCKIKENQKLINAIKTIKTLK